MAVIGTESSSALGERAELYKANKLADARLTALRILVPSRLGLTSAVQAEIERATGLKIAEIIPPEVSPVPAAQVGNGTK